MSLELQRGEITPDRESDALVRWYEPGDETGVLSLFEAVFGTVHGPDWFDWRYDTPYLDHVPVLVAEHGAEIVGARTFLPFHVRAGDRTVLAIQPAAAMVRADHRGQGIFTRMVGRTFEDYADRGVDLVFNFPTPIAKRLDIELGWREVGWIPSWYRVHRPSSFVEGNGSTGIGTVLDGAAAVLTRGTALTRPSNGTVTIERYHGVATDRLAAMYQRAVPDRLHVVRDRTFYGWRYANPEWECVTFVARRDGEPAGALLTATSDGDQPTTGMMDLVPLDPGARDPTVVGALLNAAVGHHRRSHLIRAVDSIAPDRLLWRCGFVRNDVPIAAHLFKRIEMVARPFDAADEGAWGLGERRIDDPDHWIVALGDIDAPV